MRVREIMGVPINYNIRNLVQRKGTSLMTAFGIGLTVTVLVTAVALTQGLNAVFAGSGDARQFIVLRKGADAELSSTVSTESYQIIRRLPGIATDEAGEPLVSPEALTVVNLPSVDSPDGMNVSVRGLLPVGLKMRPFTITRGQAIEPGRRQVIVGEAVAKRYPAAQIGKQIRFGRGMWDVVGVFKSGESAANSEIWTDLDQLRGDFEQQGGSSSLLVRSNLSDEEAGRQIEAAKLETAKLQKIKGNENKTVKPAFVEAFRLDDDRRLNAAAISEKQYYADLTKKGLSLNWLGFVVSVIMAVGSAFAATNTMYAAVARRGREIGTLRALGFGRAAILRSFFLESVALALFGGVVGVLLALPLNGLTTGFGNFSTFSETAFQLKVGPLGIAVGLGFAALIGAIGGFLPAWSASRKGVVAAMRDL